MLFSEAKRILNHAGYKLTEANENDVTVTVKVNISHDTTITADERTKEGRRKFHMYKKSFGIKESAEDVKKMGSSTVGMFHKSEEKNKSWTWMDFEAIKSFFGDKGISVTEQHTQATVSKEVNDEPVSTGNFDKAGPYGDGSASVWYFTTNTSRTWLFTLNGSADSFDSLDDIEEIFNENMSEGLPAYNSDSADDYKISVTVK